MSNFKVRKKEFAMELLKDGFDIINVIPESDGKLSYIFEDSLELQVAFNNLLASYKSLDVLRKLSLWDIRLLEGMLEGQEVEDKEKVRLLNKLGDIGNVIEDRMYKDRALKVADTNAVIDVNDLKKSMTGRK